MSSATDAQTSLAAAQSSAASATTAAQAAQEAVSAVTATNDGIIATNIENPASLTAGALSATIGEAVAEVVEVIPTATGPNTVVAGHPANAIAADVERSVILGGGTATSNNVIGGDGANVNTATPNATQPGTGAHVSMVGGYDNSAGSLSSKIISDHSKTEVGGQGHNAIYGGAEHTITSGGGFSGIFAGYQNVVSALYAFATGLRNAVSGQGSFAAGTDNTVSGQYGSAFGTLNTVSGASGEAHGSTNTAAGNYGSARGWFAHARTVGQHAHAGGRFAALGDAQTSVVTMFKKTTDATQTTLGVIQSNTSHQLTANQTVVFEATVVARVEGGTDSAAFKVTGAYRRGATGTPVAVGTPAVTTIGADAGAATWAVSVSADSAGGLNVRITGEAAKTIRWVQRMVLTEVTV